jgi:hypothetical protein
MCHTFILIEKRIRKYGGASTDKMEVSFLYIWFTANAILQQVHVNT